VHCIAGRSNANISWILLEISPGNLLEVCSVKFVDTLVVTDWAKLVPWLPVC